jgi:multidrug efflux system membrane fusion protein
VPLSGKANFSLQPIATAATAFIVVSVITANQGCSRRSPPPAPPPPTVTVSKPVQREVIDWDTYTGFLASPQSVDVRARVSGQIVSVPFKEGDIVQQGQTLVKIDVRPFQADLDAKLAAVEVNKAKVSLTAADLSRVEQAAKTKGAVAAQDIDTAKANKQQAEALLDAANAAVEASRLDVEWCNVIAPISGRISYRYVTEGNLISGGSDAATLLTTIQSIDPMYCYVDVDEGSVLKYKRLDAEQKRVSARKTHMACFMQLANETNYPHAGYIDFIDNKVIQSTGTLRVRGVYPNPDAFLEPGLFARIRVPGSERYNALLIPEAGISTQQNLKYVYVLGAGNKAEFRTITPGSLFGSLRSVAEGIGPDDRIIVNGLLSIHDGSLVTPQEAPISMAGFEQPAPGSPATQSLPTTQRMPVEKTTAATHASGHDEDIQRPNGAQGIPDSSGGPGDTPR